MSKSIQIRNDLIETLRTLKGNDKSYSDVLDRLLNDNESMTNRIASMTSGEVNKEGRIKGLSPGQKIRYEVIE